MKRSHLHPLGWFAGVGLIRILLLDPVDASAQGNQADYERAKNLRKLTENKVFRDRVQPTWLPGSTQFWYQVRTGAEECLGLDWQPSREFDIISTHASP